MFVSNNAKASIRNIFLVRASHYFRMLHDLIGVDKTELQYFFDNSNKAIIFNGKNWQHKPLTHDKHVYNTSRKLDKFFAEKIKKYVRSKKPEVGAFASKTIKELVVPHINNNYVLATDIRHYFESIHIDIVEEEIASIAEITDFSGVIKDFYFDKRGCLKRGLIASPMISELVGFKIDNIVNRILNDLGLSKAYVRYYDDLFIFSSDKSKLLELLYQLETVLKDQLHLELNHKKTKIVHTNGLQILGLRIHGGKVRVSKQFIKKIRAMDHRYQNTSIDSRDLSSLYAAKSFAGSIVGTLRHIMNNWDGIDNKKPYRPLFIQYWEEIERLDDLIQDLESEIHEGESIYQ